MTYQITVRPEAAREVQDAFDRYEEKSEGLGTEFLRAAEACLAGVKRSPSAFPMVHEQVHRAFLRKFPYMLFYVVRDENIIVLACFHAKRNPIDWMRRV